MGVRTKACTGVQVELKAFPLKLAEPVRETTIQVPPRVPAPEAPKKGSVQAEAVEGLVNITGGDLPARGALTL